MEICYGPTYGRYRQFKNHLLFKTLLSSKKEYCYKIGINIGPFPFHKNASNISHLFTFKYDIHFVFIYF